MDEIEKDLQEVRPLQFSGLMILQYGKMKVTKGRTLVKINFRHNRKSRLVYDYIFEHRVGNSQLRGAHT